MKRRKFPRLLFIIFLLAGVVFFGRNAYSFLAGGSAAPAQEQTDTVKSGKRYAAMEEVLSAARGLLSGEPREVQKLRKLKVAQTDEGHQEYYFQFLDDQGKRSYREMLTGIRDREVQFYLTTGDDSQVDVIYHALLKDHPELFWVHNREQVYKTTYAGSDYCSFAPGYTYTDPEMEEISQAMENSYQEVLAQIPEGAGDYEKVQAVYTYVIENTEYVASEHDQSIAGTFWKREAVCAGYAGAVQYLLERMGIPVIYVEGDAVNNTEGHAWNMVQLDGEYYYVDATNGDQPEFLEGDAVQLAEHKTTIYDYLCPFPDEYEMNYVPSEEFPLPDCTATDKNFYVLNDACFDTYDWQTIYEYCKMRIDNGAAVVRFKFTSQEAFDAAYEEWITEQSVQEVAKYYMELYGMRQVEYHYGILDNLKTIYYMF